MSRVGLLDVDGRGYPNFALMKVSAHHKAAGDHVEMAIPMEFYDVLYASKIFTFSPEPDYGLYGFDRLFKGGTGYDVSLQLPPDVDARTDPDYSLYDFPFSIQFLSRGCVRRCKFCVVREKEGDIRPVEPCALNPRGEWIEVFDNNFFANPEWKMSIDYLISTKQKVNLHGVDVRLLNEEQAFWLNKLKLKRNVHIAWDSGKMDLTDKLKEITQWVRPYKLTCYVLVGFDSTPEEDLYRLRRLKELKIQPFVMPYRDLHASEETPVSQYHKDLARWCNRMESFKTCDFMQYSPRKGFCCDTYFHNDLE